MGGGGDLCGLGCIGITVYTASSLCRVQGLGTIGLYGLGIWLCVEVFGVWAAQGWGAGLQPREDQGMSPAPF